MNVMQFLSGRRRRQLANDWTKSSFSAHNGNCVEVAGLATETVRMRDSKDQCGSVLNFADPAEWDAFVDGVKKGEFNRRSRSG